MVRMRNIGVALLLVLVIIPLHGAALTTGPPGDDLLHDDAHSGRDAEDACVPGRVPSIVTGRGDILEGMLAPTGDKADHYGVDVRSSGVLSIRYLSAPDGSALARSLVDHLAPVRLSVSGMGCAVINETMTRDGEAVLEIEVDTGLYVVGVHASHGPAMAKGRTAGASALCHPPCAMAGYSITFE